MTDIEQAPVFFFFFFFETNNISGMERLESYISYCCVGSFSYEPNHQRDGGSFKTWWSTVQKESGSLLGWEEVGRGWVYTKKGAVGVGVGMASPEPVWGMKRMG